MILKRSLLACVCILLSFSTYAQVRKFTISGYVKDASSGETLIGSAVSVKPINKGVASNEYGFYSLTLEEGTYILQCTFLGYKTITDTIELNKNIRVNFNLYDNSIQSKEVVIIGNKDENYKSTQMSTQTLQMEKIKTLPVILGEVDILKTLQLLPGVQSAGEGNSGFYVRGGGPDQNLVLLDEATVYNTGHLFGFFSVFNSDAINSVTLIKGGMPAEYGGRLSSVVNVNMKDGNNQKFHATGGIGLIASRLTIEGPIQKNKSSFMVAGRRTYIDALIKPFVNKESDLAGSGYYFYDLNTKLNYQFSDKDRVFLSGYFGKDKFTFKGDRFNISFPWGNTTATARWNHLFNDKLFVNTTAIYSDYTFELGASQNDIDFKLFSGIRDYNTKVDFEYFPNVRNNIKFGAIYTYHIFTPTTASGSAGETSFTPEKINRQHAHEAAFYFSDDFDLTERIRLNAGIRYSLFEQVGPYDRYVATSNGNIYDTISYKSGEHIKFYDGIEPRLSIRYQLTKSSSVKASYTITNQYVHLASLSGSTLPTDLWVPSSALVEPQLCTQYAIGYFRNFKEDMFETSVEIYYKDLQNQIDFKEAAGTDFSTNIENAFTFGTGEAYGAEFFIKKSQGKFNGWIGYTHSYTYRTFPELNQGKTFPARYDRRHDGSIVLSYTLNPKWTFGSVFVYGSGSAFNLPVSLVFISGIPQLYYEPDYRNKYRLKPYHRLDLSATYTAKKTDKYESIWNFSIYNVYNRMNQYIIYLETEGNVQTGGIKNQGKQVTVFPIIPSVTWNFKF
jgi:outer membrane receptor protein involved in Fe transport